MAKVSGRGDPDGKMLLFETEMLLKVHDLRAWSPAQQCSKVKLFGAFGWKALTSTTD
jgi:hypothetical protein